MEEIFELTKRIPKAYYLPIGLGCIGLILFVYGTVVILGNNQSREKLSFQHISQASESAVLGSKIADTMSVDVEGAVASPSVVAVSTTARVEDALIAAGGLSAAADRQWVAQHINLAAKLTDGAKIYIPKVGEQVTTVSSSENGLIQPQNQQININSATSDELDNLPGVGPVTAQKIIAGRPYNSVEDLQSRKIVSTSVYQKIKDLVVAY